MPHPPSHRVGDKRRYYYYSGAPRYGGFKKGYSTGPNVSQPGSLMSINRPSRYDPNSPRKPINASFSSAAPGQASETTTGTSSETSISTGMAGATSLRVGSRYNPDVDVTTSAADGPLNGGVSRYSGSRYNAQSRSRLEAINISSNINSPSGYYSRSNKWRMGSGNPNKLDYDGPNGPNGNNGRPPFWRFQKRSPPVSSRGLSPHVHSSRPNSPGPSQVGPPSRVATAPAKLPISSYSHSHSHSYSCSHSHSHSHPYSHSHLHTFSRSQSAVAEAAVTNRSAQVRIETPVKKATPPKGHVPMENEDQRNLPSPISKPLTFVPSPDGAREGSEAIENHDITLSTTSVSASATVPSRIESSGPEGPLESVSTPVSSRVEISKPEVDPKNVSNIHSPITCKDKQPENDKAESSKVKDNPRSLGSSLINSVPQQTRKQKHGNSVEDIEGLNNNNNNNTNANNNSGYNNNNRINSESGNISNEDDDNNNSDNNNNNGSNSINTYRDEGDEYNNNYNRESDGLWSSEKEISTMKNDLSPALKVPFKRVLSRCEEYEYICDPALLKQDLTSLEREELKNYDEPLESIEACIFPMTREQTRLWELKNQPWDRIIALQHHRLKDPIKDMHSYPFVRQNIIMHKQAIRPLLCGYISKLKRHEYLQKLKLKKEAQIIDRQWQHDCEEMDAMSHELHKEEIRRKEKQEMEAKEKESKENESQRGRGKSLSSSRRRNRADFVDDAEMENVLLQIDPVYKHIQAAAEIPPMIIDPLRRGAFKFKDVNNLVTDKDSWAKRVKTDGVDNFAQHEHELFVEAYLAFPKRFLKISNHLGHLRTPEECVLHYYRTKSVVDYKKLLIEKNKKRQKSSTTKRRKKERANDTDNESSLSISEHGDRRGEFSIDQIEQEEIRTGKHMEQVEIRVPEGLPVSMDGPSRQAHERKQQSPSDGGSSFFKREEEQQHTDPSIVNGSVGYNSDGEHRVLAKKMTAKAVLNGDFTAPKTFASSTPSDNRDDFGDTSDATNEDVQQRKRYKHSGEHKSSYWSVKEATLFPDLLKEHGSQWSLISERLGTKSTTMVRNYYQRNAAQFGWKSLVEEADFKRNATSSGSVQQSQMLLQSEQGPLTVSNGVPSQLWPALGFFSNSNVSAANGANGDVGQKKELPSMATAGETLPSSAPAVGGSQQSFSSTVDNKESFPTDIPPPVSELPAPRLPSILLPISSEGKKEKPITSAQLKNPGNGGETARFKAPAVSEWSQPLPPVGIPSTLRIDRTQWFNSIHSQPVTREVQGTGTSLSNSSCRSNSLSLLLNPDTDRPVSRSPLAPLASQKKHESINQTSDLQSQVPQPPLLGTNVTAAIPKINFAMDPLRALAAVASESLLETDNSSQLPHK